MVDGVGAGVLSRRLGSCGAEESGFSIWVGRRAGWERKEEEGTARRGDRSLWWL